ncbi:MAG: S41 family peptidase [Mariniphaga sp.]
MKNLSFIFTSLVVALLLVNCKKSDPITVKLPVVVKPTVIPDANAINKFVYNGLKDYYLWVDNVPSLTAQKYSIKDSLNYFLNTYTDPAKLFNGLLYTTLDKWSFIVDDSQTITDWIQGISETMGFDFKLGYIGSTENLFGFVRYVYKGSPAEKAGMKRGDLFMKIDDTQLTISNYQTLLFTKLTYKISFASITSVNSVSTIALNGNTATMTAIKMQENPILLDTVLNVNNLKVGYLVYNAFNADFDVQLNNVFGKFKSSGIDRLVLDLRYNGGGSVQTAVYLASMIYGTSKTKAFLKRQYNKGLQDYFISTEGASSLSQSFTDSITTSTPKAKINTLNLNKLYVITSSNSASASELLINGLEPYLDVVNIGWNTAGKYVASATIRDWDANGVVNPNHKWAMQPIIVKTTNSLGVSDFVNGLVPDIALKEDIANLLPFGDQNETLLKSVISNLKGAALTPVESKSAKIGWVDAFDSQDHKPFAKQMYIAPLLDIHKN